MRSTPAQNRIIVISYKDDWHLHFVQKHLDTPFILLDHTSTIAGRPLTYRLDRGNVLLTCNDEPLQHVSGVWYRRDEPLAARELPTTKNLQPFSHKALMAFYALIRTRFPGATWMSDYYAIRRAEDDKMWQLEVAADMGFNVPATIATSSSDEAQAFLKEQHGIAIAKSINNDFFMQDGDKRCFYSSRVTSSTNFSGLNLAPAIFQQLVDTDKDIRAIVVGDKVFAAAIMEDEHQQTDDAHVRDWRRGILGGGIQIDAWKLPSKIEKLCIQHVKQLGLNFGAIDLVLDKKGKYWFLENNPNGQWSFIEEHTGHPIGKAIAALLTVGHEYVNLRRSN